MTPGELMKRRRRAMDNMSQQDLAVLVGATLTAVSQWERGINTPRRYMAERLDEALTAGGTVLAAFGYSPPASVLNLPDEVEALRQRVDDLSVRLDRAAASIARQGAELDLLRAQRRQATGQ